MFELLVPAERQQLEKLNGDKKAYDTQLRPQLMVRAIEELQDAGVEPDVWKIEGLDRERGLQEDCEDCAARWAGQRQLHHPGPGRGRPKVREWLTHGCGCGGFIGFAVGRTDFWDPLVNWRAGKSRRVIRQLPRWRSAIGSLWTCLRRRKARKLQANSYFYRSYGDFE